MNIKISSGKLLRLSLFLPAALLGLGMASAYIFLTGTEARSSSKPQDLKPLKYARTTQPLPVYSPVGEKITYDVKFGGLSLGRAVFYHVSKSELYNREVDFITFETKVKNFYDLEKIYSDAQTFLPLKIERQIRNFGSRESIIETYDQKKFVLTIDKTKGKSKKQFLIKRDNVIHNAILLPYFVRHIPKLEVGWALAAHFPTQSFTIKLISLEEITVPAGKFQSYHFASQPKKFDIWITADQRRLPVKIKGTGSLGYTMVMRKE